MSWGFNEHRTYADLAGRLGTSREAARSLVRRLRLPRMTANDGSVRVNLDLTEIQYNPQPRRSPCGHRANFEALKAEVERLQAEVAELKSEKSSFKAIAAEHRADFERERQRSDKLMTNAMRLVAVATLARAKAARLEGELTELRSRSWLRRRARNERPAPPNELTSADVAPMQSETFDTPWCEPPLSGWRMAAEVAALAVFALLITAFVEFGIPFLVQ